MFGYNPDHTYYFVPMNVSAKTFVAHRTEQNNTPNPFANPNVERDNNIPMSQQVELVRIEIELRRKMLTTA